MSERGNHNAELERDALLVEVLYGERASASDSAEGDEPGENLLKEDERRELGELRELRELFAALPEAEPPPRITSQLLAAAAAEVAAAGSASRPPRDGSSHPWWRRWLLALSARPAVAAAASLVVIVGVAGVLHVRGDLRPAQDSAGPRLGEPAVTTPAPEEPFGDTPGDGELAPEPTTREAEGSPQGGLELDDLARGFERDSEVATGAAGGRAADEPAGPGGGGASLRDSRTRRRRARPAKQRRGVKSNARREDALKNRESGTGASPAPKSEPRPASPAGKNAPAAKDAPPPPPEPQSQDTESSERPAPPPTAIKLLERARQLAREGDCAEALRIGERIRSISADFYRRRVQPDKLLAACRAELPSSY